MKKLLSIMILALLLPASGLQAQGFRMPAYSEHKLPNGLTLLLMEQHEVPLISMQLAFDAGFTRDGEHAGLASLTNSCLKDGAGERARFEIESELDMVGASLNTFCGAESAGISAKVHKDEFPLVLSIVEDLVYRPRFPDNEFDKHKRRAVQELEQNRESPRAVITDYWNQFLFGSHAYGNSSGGTMKSVEGIGRDDVVNYWQRYYHPANGVLAVVGDFDSKEMLKLIRTALEDWKPAKFKKAPALAAPTVKAENQVLLVNKEDARETTFFIGGAGVPANHPDRVAIDVVNTVFGGRFTSWLNDALRVNSGLTYGARCSWRRNRLGGSVAITTFTATETTERAIDMALDVLDSLHTHGIDKATLESAKAYVKGGFPPDYETSGSLANLLVDMKTYGYTDDYINRFEAEVDAMTVERANEIIHKYFPRKRLRFLLIGRAEDIRDIAKKYGPVTEKEITDDGF